MLIPGQVLFLTLAGGILITTLVAVALAGPAGHSVVGALVEDAGRPKNPPLAEIIDSYGHF